MDTINLLKKWSFFLVLVLAGLTSGCLASTREDTEGSVPTPVVEEILADLDPVLREIPVETVAIEIGQGSPIPVEVVVSGVWPDLCAQIARIEQKVMGGQIEVSLWATPVDPDCPPDFVGLPFAMAIPLNMVEMPEGAYTLSVNGATTAFDWIPTAGAPAGDPLVSNTLSLVYIGPDGNLWGLQQPEGDPRQLTSDARPATGSDETINYYFPRISSDGTLVAYRRDVGKPTASGYDFQFGMWVLDVTTNESRELYNQVPAGFSWKPNSHVLTFGKSVAEEYFSRDGAPSIEYAAGIWAVDVDSGMVTELVRPERGFALYTPVWSPDGRFVAFDELFGYEGRGRFAMFDFENNKYVAWDEQIGNYAWSPDGRELAYDRLTYTAVGVERIFVKNIQNDQEQQLSPTPGSGYAFWPVFAPSGDQIAYLAGLGGTDSQLFTLYLQAIAGGDPRSLGTYESVLELDWSADGTQLIFSAGPYNKQRVYAVDVVTGESQPLADGTQPDVAGR